MDMIIVFWIAFVGILGAIGVAVVSILKTLRTPRWGPVLTETMKRRELSIDAPGGPYKAFLYTSADFDESTAMPGMIVLPDRGEKYPAFEHWASIFALQGFPTLAVELVAKGVSDQDFIEGIVRAFPAFKNKLIENAKVDESRIGIFGFGVPAVAGIYAGATDGDVKVICCAGMPRVDPTRAAGAKGKVFLAHCKNDGVAPILDFTGNKESLAIGEKEYLLLELGGHKFLSQEAVIAGYFSIPVNRALKPAYKQFTPKGVVMP
jgi:dienelactone hydrolase